MKMKPVGLLDSFNGLIILVLLVLFVRSVLADRPDFPLLAVTITFSIYWVARRFQNK